VNPIPNPRLRYISMINDRFHTKQTLLFYRGETVLDSTVLVSGKVEVGD
jgi:hypothetical protein